jgi:alkanesulfonate monooxygenase SsuD/methylene tetrahydromethanopterin reductase-like flavin-dependent oxidoreductase (luciferase family)
MATCNGYRNPALLAKMAATVDVMSHGRLILGLGAGWYEHEWRAYGYGFPELRERMGRFREAAEIVHRMLSEDEPVFHGRYYTIDRPINEPKGAQRPHVPLWIAGEGEQVTLKLVAQWGDGCNVGGGDPEEIRHKLDVLQRHCEAIGRDYDTITRSTSLEGVHLVQSEATAERETAPVRGGQSYTDFAASGLVLPADQLAERIHAAAEAGAQVVLLHFPAAAHDPSQVRRFAEEVMPRFQTAARG